MFPILSPPAYFHILLCVSFCQIVTCCSFLIVKPSSPFKGVISSFPDLVSSLYCLCYYEQWSCFWVNMVFLCSACSGSSHHSAWQTLTNISNIKSLTICLTLFAFAASSWGLSSSASFSYTFNISYTLVNMSWPLALIWLHTDFPPLLSTCKSPALVSGLLPHYLSFAAFISLPVNWRVVPSCSLQPFIGNTAVLAHVTLDYRFFIFIRLLSCLTHLQRLRLCFFLHDLISNHVPGTVMANKC